MKPCILFVAFPLLRVYYIVTALPPMGDSANRGSAATLGLVGLRKSVSTYRVGKRDLHEHTAAA